MGKTWKQMYDSLKSATDRVVAENGQLKAQIETQIMVNDSVGQEIMQQGDMIQAQVTGHNRETQEMGKEIQRLRQKIRDLGGDPDDD